METQYGKSAVDEEMKMKRRASSDEWTMNKKRVLNSRMGSPVASNGSIGSPLQLVSNNETNADEPENEDELERFRKAAIFRRMRHYQRECGRAAERAQHLEDSLRLSKLERIEAEACWTNTLEMIRKLVQLDELNAETDGTLKNSFPSRIFSPDDFQKSRKSSEAKYRAAERVIKAFAKLVGKVDRPKYEELVSECQDLQQSNTFLKAEAEETYTRLQDAQRDRDRYLEELRIAEAKLDRANSQILNSVVCRKQETAPVKVNGEAKTEPVQDESGVKKEDTPTVTGIVQEARSPRILSEAQTDDIKELESRVERRDLEIQRLTSEVSRLREENIEARAKLKHLGEDVVTNTPTYKRLLDKASKILHMLKAEQVEASKVRAEAKKLRSIQETWREQLEANENKQLEELRILLKKRDEDLARIRQQREQLEVQQKELKATLDTRRHSFAKYKELAESRGERIELLNSEIRRLKTRLSAAAGDEDLLKFLQNDANIDKDYVEDLRQRLKTAETELRNLRSSLKDKERRLVDIASLQSKLDAALRELDLYKQNDTGALAEKLKAKDEELRVLKLKEEQTAQEMTELFSEMDRLSKAWETADKQAHAQVVSVEKWEEEKEKLTVAKQKSDNKFFKTMAELEAKEAERKQTLRHAEVLAKQIDAHGKKERELLAVNESLASELKGVKTELEDVARDLRFQEEGKQGYRDLVEDEREKLSVLSEELTKREQECAEANAATLKLKDELHKAKREAEKAVQKAKKSTVPASERESELQHEADKLMKVLKCSTCQQNFRSEVILKCMHTFCKPCIDARLNHRQRKCPSCNIQFGQSDVQRIFFQ